MYTCQTYYRPSAITIAYDAHGILGGASTWARGGNFSIGFASGAVASLMTTTAGMLTQNLCEAWQVTCMVAAGTLSGGVTATMAGGSFWEGVCNGLICSGLNHAMHMIAGPDDPPGKQNTNVNSRNKENVKRNENLTNIGQTGGGIATAVDGAATKASMETLSITSKVFGGTFVFVSETPDILTAWNDPNLENITKVVVGTGLGVVTVVANPIVATGAFVLGIVNAFGGFDKGYLYLNNIKSNNN